MLVPIQRTGEKNGSNRHIPVDGIGVPLSIIVTGANRHDVSQLAAVLDGRVVSPPEGTVQNLCAYKGYTGEPAKEINNERTGLCSTCKATRRGNRGQEEYSGL